MRVLREEQLLPLTQCPTNAARQRRARGRGLPARTGAGIIPAPAFPACGSRNGSCLSPASWHGHQRCSEYGNFHYAAALCLCQRQPERPRGAGGLARALGSGSQVPPTPERSLPAAFMCLGLAAPLGSRGAVPQECLRAVTARAGSVPLSSSQSPVPAISVRPCPTGAGLM